MSEIKFANHFEAQHRATKVLHEMSDYIRVGFSEQDIAEHCQQLLLQHGLTETWYYHVPALVYVGTRTTASMSGRQYQPSDQRVQHHDWVTIALSPKYNNCWGAMARTYFMSDDISPIRDAQHQLHQSLLTIARPEMTFHDLYKTFNQMILEMGYVNLDYNNNLGHSLVNDLSERQFIEANNQTLLKDCALFAFETHIGKEGESFGSKHENVYYFNNNQLHMLTG